MKYANYKKMSTEKILARMSDEEECWSYMAALRGPDSGNETIKKLFTCFIRGGCYVAWGITFFAIFIHTFHKMGIERKSYLIELSIALMGMNEHYRSHVSQGLEVVYKHFNGEVKRIANSLLIICNNTYDLSEDDTEFLNSHLKAIAVIVCK